MYSIDNLNSEFIYQLLKDYEFEIIDKKWSNLSCGLCAKLLNETRVSPSGCQFCRQCIEDYLANGEKNCPTISDDCQGEILSLEKNVLTDHIADRKIFNLKVKCPIKECEYIDHIKNIGNHLTGCIDQAFKCQYRSIGCQYASLDENDIGNHMKRHKDEHIRLLTVNMEGMKSEVDLLIRKNESMKHESNEKQIEIEKLKNQLINMEIVNDYKLDEFQKKMETVKMDTTKEIDKMKIQMEQLNAMAKDREINDKKLNEENIKLKSLLTSKELLVHQKDAELTQKQLFIDSIKSLFDPFVRGDKKEFLWTVKNVSELKANCTMTCSDEFYYFLNKITVQLQFRFDAFTTGFNVVPVITDNDLKLTPYWRYTQEMTIGIVNQNTGFFCKSIKKLIESSVTYMTNFVFAANDLPQTFIHKDTILIKCIIEVKKW